MYVNLFLRTFSQTLQAFTPIVFAMTWFERSGDASLRSAIRQGLTLSMPTTVVAGWLFQRSAHRALDEALFAMVTVTITSMFAVMMWRRAANTSHMCSHDHHRAALWAVTGV